jgi:hypothetical protein
MKIASLRVTEGWDANRRLVGQMAVAGLLCVASILLMQSGALASGGLSSTILSIPAPGFVAAPLGTANGPMTPSNVAQVLGSNEGPSSALGQSLADGTITAYIRSWDHQPINGDAIVIAGFQFTTASDETSFANGLATQMRSQAGSASFPVTDIPGASGAAVHTSTSNGTPLAEFIVSFAKGNTVFQVVIATTSGDLTSGNAASVASEQFADAPDTPLAGPGFHWRLSRIVPLCGIPFCIVIILLGRRRKYPPALRAYPYRGGHDASFTALVPSGPGGISSSPVGPVSTEERPKVGAERWQ